MAHYTFEEVHQHPNEMTLITNTGKVYSGFYSELRLDRSTLPDGWHAYDFRETDESGEIGTLEENYVMVNNLGSFYMQGEIEELRKPRSFVNLHTEQCENYVDDWNYIFGSLERNR